MVRTCIGAFILATLGSTALAQGSGSAGAEAYPTRPITVVYPAAAGGAGDPSVRIVMEQVAKILGQPVVVENRPGGNFTIGPRAVLAAPSDGYTLLETFPGHINMKAFMTLPYDPIESFTPIAKLSKATYWFVVNPKLPVKDFKEFVEYAKTNQVNHGTLATGSNGHVFAERVNAQFGTKILSAPYKGEAPIMTELIGGTLDACFCSPSTVINHVRAGKLRVLASTSLARSAVAPEVPTFKEQGFVGSHFEYTTWLGVFGPARMPPERVAKVAAALQTAMQQPHIVDFLKGNTTEVDYKGPAEFKGFLTASLADWVSDVKKSNIKLD